MKYLEQLLWNLVLQILFDCQRSKLYFFSSPTLYVGDHTYGLYALPSLVDQNVVTITASDSGPLLLGGPHAPTGPKPYPEYPIPGYNYRIPSSEFFFLSRVLILIFGRLIFFF